jgi:hypothetical protein
MSTTDTPKIFRVTLEIASLDEAAGFYARLLCFVEDGTLYT